MSTTNTPTERPRAHIAPTRGPARRTLRSLRHVLVILAAIAAILATVGCSEDAPDEDEAYLGEGAISDELPITRVALYQNGVGYFERTGTIEGDVLTLRIRPDQINDILKSLTVIDLGDGRPVSISLPVDKQAIDAISAIPEQIRDDGGMLSLLRAFRGANVTLHTGQRHLTGRVVGLEELGGTSEDGRWVPNWKATIKTESGLEVVPVDAITALDIQDRTLEVGLEKSLDISLNDGSWKPIELKVRMNASEGPRQVRVSYIVAMPVWKPAYRLVLDEGDGLFQGWAVVDNVSGSDWSDVSMALVAGTPMSFVYDLYKPQYVSRPDLTPHGARVAMAPELVESARANEHYAQGGIGGYGTTSTADATTALEGDSWNSPNDYRDLDEAPEMPKSAPARARAGVKNDKLAANTGSEAMAWKDAAPIGAADYERSFQTAAAGSEISALFQYDIEAPVTVPDRSSSLVNLMQSRGPSKEIVLFQPELYTMHDDLLPSRAVEFHNTSGNTLEPGPITLYRDGTFIGEGFLGRTEKDEVAFVTFAHDPEVHLKSRWADTEEAASIQRIDAGTIYSEVKAVTTVSWDIRNERAEPIRAMVRRPVRAGFTLDPMPPGTLEAGGSYFIPVELAAGETKTVELREVTPVRRELSIDSSLALELIQLEIDNAHLEPALVERLEEVIETQAKLGDIRHELQGLYKKKRLHEDEQSRIASALNNIENIKEGAAKKLRSELSQRALGILEKIEAASTRITELELQETDLDITLRALFASVSFEAPDGADQEDAAP